MDKSKLVMAWGCDDILAKSPTAPHGSIDRGKKDFILRVVEKVIYNSSEVANYVKITDKLAKCIVFARGYRYMHELNAGRVPDFGPRLPVSGFCLSKRLHDKGLGRNTGCEPPSRISGGGWP